MYKVVVNRFSVVGPVELGGSRVREIFFLVSLTLSLLGSWSIFFSGFERVFHSIYVFVNTISGSLLKGRSRLWDNRTRLHSAF